jgi:hypothetical protein
VVTRFSSVQLEDLLTSSTKNVAHEVVSCMIPKPGESGLLLILEKEVKELDLSEFNNNRSKGYSSSFAGTTTNSYLTSHRGGNND